MKRSDLSPSALFVATALLFVGCESRSPGRVVYERLIDMAAADSGGTGSLAAVFRGNQPAEVRDVGIHGDRRPSVVFHAPASLSFRVSVPPEARFEFGLAVRPPESNVEWRLVTGMGEVIHDRDWQEERGWTERSIDLSRFAGETLSLELSFEGAEAEVMLAHPVVVGRADRERAKRPNVLVYVVDCLRADHVGSYGYELPTTPEVDTLTRDSVVLDELIACAPWTKPSTGCLFTSLLPMQHKAQTVDDALSHGRTTVAEVFRDAGYMTAAWVANPVIDPRVFFFNQGFDRWVDLRSFEERTERSHINALSPDAAEITEGVLPWLAAHRDKDFFVYLHSLDLHYEYRPRLPFSEILVTDDSTGLDRDRELYDSELAYNDNEIGKLIGTLKELGLYDDTLILVTADHGEEFGEHGFDRHGKTLYRQVLRVPGIFKMPNSHLAGRRVMNLTSNVDLGPTLLDIAGVETPDSFEGQSILPILEKTTKSHQQRTFAELVSPKSVIYAVRDGRYKYIRQLLPELQESLFDLRADPGEEENLMLEPPEDARALLPSLERFIQLGQQGFHLSIKAEHPGEKMEVEVVTEAEIGNAFRFSIVTGDMFELSEDRKRLTLQFLSDEKKRHLVVQTRPEGEPVRVRILSDGVPLEGKVVEMGVRGETLSVPVTADVHNSLVSMDDAERLLREDETAVRLWYLDADAGRNRVELDEETKKVLEALGYIQ